MLELLSTSVLSQALPYLPLVTCNGRAFVCSCFIQPLIPSFMLTLPAALPGIVLSAGHTHRAFLWTEETANSQPNVLSGDSE